MRLWGGQSEREGEVQVCKDGVWGYICSDTWNDVNAKTVCKQLQFSDTCKLWAEDYWVWITELKFCTLVL